MSKVSVIIPYNIDRGWLNEAIESVEKQTHKDIELILSQSDNGVSYNINRGIEKATGEFIKFFAEDDLLTPNCIEDSLKAIEGHDFIHGNAFNFNKKRPSLSNTHIPRVQIPSLNDMLVNNVIHGGTLMYRKDVFERFGMFDESLWTGEEYEFNLRIISKGARINYCNKLVFHFRLHEAQKSIGKHTIEYKNKRRAEIDRIKSLYR